MSNLSPPVFPVHVEGVGTFSFIKRTMREELRIQAEYSRLTEGCETPTPYLNLVATWLSTLKVLTKEAPSGWDLEAIDPLDQDSYQKLMAVHGALRQKEDSFRPRPAAVGAQGGAPAVPDHGVSLQASVQPAAH